MELISQFFLSQEDKSSFLGLCLIPLIIITDCFYHQSPWGRILGVIFEDFPSSSAISRKSLLLKEHVLL